MNINIYKKPVNSNIEDIIQKKTKNVLVQNTPSFRASGGLDALENYNRYMVIRNFQNKKTENNQKWEILEKLGIPNCSITLNGGIRGESLSSKKNRKFLKPIKECGITKIIDLRDKYTSKEFPDLCERYGFEYFNIPVDSSSVSDRIIIDNFPVLFDTINGGNYYIACAQGLHRTDIALALDYVFNPAAEEPPILIGHFREGVLKTDDISRRLNSIKNKLTGEDLNKLGWDESFEEEFSRRKYNLYDYNTQILGNSN